MCLGTPAVEYWPFIDHLLIGIVQLHDRSEAQDNI